jgi:molecular chaperone GrpE
MERTIETIGQELKAEHDLYLRALADFENYRRRMDHERGYFGREAIRGIAVSLLEIMDDLERFLNFADNHTSPFIDGMRVVHSKLLKLLEREGIHPFDSVGKPFDPALHEAVGTATVGESEAGTIVQEAQRGYLWGDQLLRTARVVVAV